MLERLSNGPSPAVQRVRTGIAMLLWLALVPAAVAQRAADSTAPASRETATAAAETAGSLRFAIVGDRAANPREGVFEAALAEIQLLRPDLVLSVGDFIHGYGDGMKPLTDEALIRQKRAHIDRSLGTLAMPFYRVVGNHDINNDLSAGIWKELYGPDYYAFVCRDVLFLCLNSQDGANHKTGISEQQIDWVRQKLSEHADAAWTCVFLHQPLWLEDAKRLETAKTQDGATRLTGFDQVEALLAGRKYSVFAGHHHQYGKWTKAGNKYLRLATTGGQSKLAGPEAGQFDHVMWVTMTGEGPVICNLLLEGILDEDARTILPTDAQGDNDGS